MSAAILIAIVLGLIVVGGGAYFVIQQNPTSQSVSENQQNNFLPDNTLPTKNTTANQPSNTQPVPSAQKENPPKSQNSQTYSKIYTNDEFGISLAHPDDWQCKTYKTNSAHPDWFQTTCEHNGVWENDPNLAISVPFVAEDHDLWVKVREATITGQNSSSVKKTVYRSAGFGGSIGMVEYIFSGSASAKSYGAYTLYGSEKPYKTAEEAEGILDAVVKTIAVKSPTNSTSQTAPNLNTVAIKITVPNGGETLKIGNTVRVSWEAQNVSSKYVGLRLEVWQISGDKPIIDSSGQCSNCTSGAMITLSNPVSSDGLANGAGSVDWKVGEKLYPLHTPPGPGNNYVLMAVAERGNTDAEAAECRQKNPSSVMCGKPWTVELGRDYSDRVFSITN